MIKAIILVGGPQKGTRFRPLSFDIPKPLFPVAGLPTVQHIIEACKTVEALKEIIIMGFYQSDAISDFVNTMSKQYDIPIRYLQEYTELGTSGGIYHFRDQIRLRNPDAFIVFNGDVCGEFQLNELLDFHLNKTSSTNLITVLHTEATPQQSVNFGCIASNKATGEILHYVEKPSTFVSEMINCGVYVCSIQLFSHLGRLFEEKQRFRESGDFAGNCIENSHESMSLEHDVLSRLANSKQAYTFPTHQFWSQMKTAASAIYSNRHYLDVYRRLHPERLSPGRKFVVIGDVFVHPTAQVHPTAVVGPNVSIGEGVSIGAGVRVRESIILGNAIVGDHTLIMYSIVGWNSEIGKWSRVEGTPCDPNPDRPFAKMENVPLFNSEGRLNPSITVLGCNVTVPPEVVVLNCIVLPHKDLSHSVKNEIIL